MLGGMLREGFGSCTTGMGYLRAISKASTPPSEAARNPTPSSLSSPSLKGVNVRVGEVMEGNTFRTRLTQRTGVVERHEADGGVAVLWVDGGRSTKLHPEVEVDGEWEEM